MTLAVVTGSDSEDPWSDRAVTAQMLACLRRAELVVIDSAGHLPNRSVSMCTIKPAFQHFPGRHQYAVQACQALNGCD